MFACDAVRRVLHTLSEGNAVCGVTSLDDLLYVLRYKPSKQIEVYNKDSYRLQHCLTVSTIDDMADIASCGHNRCLYISGYIDKCIHRVALPDADAVEWQLSEWISGLSVTHTLCWRLVFIPLR